jgi:hypothetical protein
MTCSNDVKCPNEISSFQSNFTFGQNEADPWNPSSHNEADSRVQQQQHISLSNCARFSLTSDGTKEGTQLGDIGQADDKNCPKLEKTATSIASNDVGRKTSYVEQPQIGATSMPQVKQSGYSVKRCTSRSFIWTTVLFGLLILLPGVHASTNHHRREGLNLRARLQIRAVSDKVKVFAQDFSGDLAEKMNTQDLNGEAFAHNLVASVISSVCDSYFSGTVPSDSTTVVVQDCVRRIYGGEKHAQPAVQFFAVFGASLFCDYLVSEAYPVARDFFPDVCEGLRKLARKVSPLRSAAASNTVMLGASQVREISASYQSSASLHALISSAMDFPQGSKSFVSPSDDSLLLPPSSFRADASTRAQDRPTSTNTALLSIEKTIVESTTRATLDKSGLTGSGTVLTPSPLTANTPFSKMATGLARPVTDAYPSSAKGPEFFELQARPSVSIPSSQKFPVKNSPTTRPSESLFAPNRPSSSLLPSMPVDEPLLPLLSDGVSLSATTLRENHSPSIPRPADILLLPFHSSDTSPTVTTQRETPTKNATIINQPSSTLRTPRLPSTLTSTAVNSQSNVPVVVQSASVGIFSNPSSESTSATTSSPNVLIILSALTLNTVVNSTTIRSRPKSSSSTPPTLTSHASVSFSSMGVSISPTVGIMTTTQKDDSFNVLPLSFSSTSFQGIPSPSRPRIRLHILSSINSISLVRPSIRPVGGFTAAPSRTVPSELSSRPGLGTSSPLAPTSPVNLSFGLHPASVMTPRPSFNYTTWVSPNSTLFTNKTATILGGTSLALSTNTSSSSKSNTGHLTNNSIPLLPPNGSSVALTSSSPQRSSEMLSYLSSTISLVHIWLSTTFSSLPYTHTTTSVLSASALVKTITITTNVCPSFRPDACRGTCVDHKTDRLNCGRCGARCPQGWSCGSGECWSGWAPDVQSQHTTTRGDMPLAANLVGSIITTSSVQKLHSTTPTQASKSAPKDVGRFIAKGLDGLW